MRSEVFTAVKIKIMAFLVMTPCNLVGGSAALNMEVICSSGMLVTTCARCHNREDHNPRGNKPLGSIKSGEFVD
jgi:cytochrome c553